MPLEHGGAGRLHYFYSRQWMSCMMGLQKSKTLAHLKHRLCIIKWHERRYHFMVEDKVRFIHFQASFVYQSLFIDFDEALARTAFRQRHPKFALEPKPSARKF